MEELISKCGFYCGSCSLYTNGACKGCRMQHSEGDCFTFDCVSNKGIEYCGLCEDFPCDDIINREKATVLDRDWLLWRRRVKENR